LRSVDGDDDVGTALNGVVTLMNCDCIEQVVDDGTPRGADAAVRGSEPGVPAATRPERGTAAAAAG